MEYQPTTNRYYVIEHGDNIEDCRGERFQAVANRPEDAVLFMARMDLEEFSEAAEKYDVYSLIKKPVFIGTFDTPSEEELKVVRTDHSRAACDAPPPVPEAGEDVDPDFLKTFLKSQIPSADEEEVEKAVEALLEIYSVGVRSKG